MFEETETPEIVEKVSSYIWILDENKYGHYKKCYSIAMKLDMHIVNLLFYIYSW